MNKFRYIAQVDERDCGVAALSMVLRKYGQENSLASLRDLAKTNLEGTTALGIVRAAQHLNFKTQAVKADMSLFKMKDLPLPFIVHVEKEKSILHYYVVYGITKTHLKIADPDDSVGKTKMSFADFEKEWTGVAIFLAPNPKFSPAKEETNKIFSFLPVIARQKNILVNIVTAALIITAISILSSYYLQALLDTYIPDGMKSTLTIVSIGLIIAYVIQQILSYARDYLLIILGQRLSIDVILSYVKHLFELPLTFFGTRRIGEITSRFTDANSIIDALANTAVSLFLDLGILVMVSATLAIHNTKLFLISITVLPIYASIVYIFMKPFEKLNNETMQAASIVNASIIESLNGIETIKSLSSEEISYSKIDREYVAYLKNSFKNQRLLVLQNSLKATIKLVLDVIILWVGANLVIANNISVGDLISYNALLAYFTDPLQNILNLQSKLQAASVANKRLNEVYLVPSEFNKNQRIQSNVITSNDVSLSNVSFKYGFGKNALTNVSATIKKNEKVALVGVSGSGKSTLAKLIVNFFPIEKQNGDIKISGININQIDKRELRKKVTYLPQTPYTFTGKIIDNLLLGAKPGTTIDDVFRATEIAHIRKEIELLPQGFETEISESGELSGGQRQRVALARALLTGSSILILDESTSSLDVLTEKDVIDDLLKLTNTTIIFVAHRLTIAERVDRILVMENGEIIENGTHHDLLQNKGLYAQLNNK
ncbi:peptide ABC transporter ATP-binding protein [Lactiplantibacillus pentosus]|uniref:ABC-transporter PlnG (Bacteriocin ABC transporter) n=1 Tax=Lactiplantibacillus pentosus IG1 TaxID=1042160 RepID=G0M4A0_LACPE|nr:peptide cleavage/export ABC transporter [Lactiplantibacillus pentosus]CCC17010.1 ABC-transporter PlnG (Bacteriocin ABC transporter) [Lactiplantibacillus pentosus IG1]MCT3301690.1 peptide cleavage/export ABC transporter [Lactiplantibacillus pentosus]PRO80052.1 peptide ABC transporter ATP-binding protein [Lactiplantibacillus pentosus]PRO82816.1 peptide ABC transporter ATP-binding protein [Lactiplantibacillus pentosus]PRO92719.1 peptide ABC transporter ATP-binding protein [Lactiplantibacillus 